MPAQGKLAELATRKELLRARIATRRSSLATHVHDALAPLRTADAWHARWRTMAPWAGVLGRTAGFALGRWALRSRKLRRAWSAIAVARMAARWWRSRRQR